MSKYTEQQLKSMTKDPLVSLVLELNEQLEAATSGPLKSSDIEKKVLDLQRQVINVKSNDEARKEAHEAALEKIKSDKELAIRKMELEFADSMGIEASELEETYSRLEERSKLTIEDLSFGLKKAEVETQQKIDEFNQKLEETTAKYNEEIAAKKEELRDLSIKINAEKAEVQTEHNREMEQIKYDNKIALRDENLETAKKIAQKHEATVIHNEDLDDLKAYKQAGDAELATAIESAVRTAKSEVYSQEGAKFSKLKSETDSQIALLENDKKYLSQSISTLEARVAELMDQIKNFPAQIKDAVEAAKANIQVSQDAGKK